MPNPCLSRQRGGAFRVGYSALFLGSRGPLSVVMCSVMCTVNISGAPRLQCNAPQIQSSLVCLAPHLTPLFATSYLLSGALCMPCGVGRGGGEHALCRAHAVGPGDVCFGSAKKPSLHPRPMPPTSSASSRHGATTSSTELPVPKMKVQYSYLHSSPSRSPTQSCLYLSPPPCCPALPCLSTTALHCHRFPDRLFCGPECTVTRTRANCLVKDKERGAEPCI